MLQKKAQMKASAEEIIAGEENQRGGLRSSNGLANHCVKEEYIYMSVPWIMAAHKDMANKNVYVAVCDRPHCPVPKLHRALEILPDSHSF
jgi:hypothetical protein